MDLSEDTSFLVGEGAKERIYEVCARGEHWPNVVKRGRAVHIEADALGDKAREIIEAWPEAALTSKDVKFTLNLTKARFKWELVREVNGKGESFDITMYYPDDRRDLTLVLSQRSLLSYSEWEALHT